MIYATNGENGVYAFDLALNLLWSDVLNFTNTSGVCFGANGLAAVSGNNKIRVYTPTMTTGAYEVNDVFARVYPNPASSYFVLDVGNEIFGSTFKLIDIKGGEIKTGIVSKNTIIQLDGIPQGLYFLRIDGVNQTFKVIKQ
jgi:hypothetical protein